MRGSGGCAAGRGAAAHADPQAYPRSGRFAHPLSGTRRGLTVRSGGHTPVRGSTRALPRVDTRQRATELARLRTGIIGNVIGVDGGELISG